MSQHWIYINSASYRQFVEATKERKWLLVATGAALAGVSMAAGWLVANATNPHFEEEGYKSKKAELEKLPLHSQVCFDVFVCSFSPGSAQCSSLRSAWS